ncbi:MAG: tetratricopeptide repeat protein, partial [Bacteroidota bacterium]|nr:tetratricopeptide repeat protein [Bacteroidota bacterium]
LKSILTESNDTVNIKILLQLYKYYEDNDIKKAELYVCKAFKMAIDVDNNVYLTRAYLQKGNFYTKTGNFDKAINNYNRLINYWKLVNDSTNVPRVYLNLGVVFEKKGNYPKSIEYFIKALDIFEKNADSINISKSYLNIGLLHFRLEDYKKSMLYYKKSLEIRRKLNDKKGIALLYNNMAIVNYYTEDYDNVRSYFQKAYDIYLELGLKRQQSMALSNLAEIHSNLGQIDKALNYYYKCLVVDKDLNDKKSVVADYHCIANSLNNKGQIKLAIKYHNMSLNLAKEIGARLDIKDSYESLYSIYREIGNHKKALEYHELYFALNDSIFNESKSKQITEMQEKYQSEKKEQKINLLQKEKQITDLKIKRQKYYAASLLAGFIFVFGFLIMFFNKNKRIRHKNQLLAYQKKQITDSIEYASRIQTAILPPGDFISKLIPQHFILFKPRDVVSGDFYWLTHKNNKMIVAAIDCTGHGVPGAFMSMLGFAFLNEIVNKDEELQANAILNQLRNYVKESLHQTGKYGETKDGMDAALCIIDKQNLELQFSGAYNPLYLIRNEKLQQIKGDRMPIGIHVFEKESFTNHRIKLNKNDLIYLFTDGYTDQFGGPNMKKFHNTPFKNLLVSIHQKSMKEQKEILERNYYEWKGNHEQIDDILIIGIRI